MLTIFFYDFFTYILPALITFLILGFISLPISKTLFKDNIDGGFANSQIIGLLSISWISFTIATISGLTQINFLNHKSIFNILIAVVIWVLINLTILKKNPSILALNLKKIGISFLLTSLLLLFFYLINSFKALVVVTGSENFMNLGILNSILYSEKIPINDFWFSGNTLNYYYFTHYAIFLISKILNFNPNNDLSFLYTFYPTLFSSSFIILTLSIIKNYSEKISKVKLLFISLLNFIFILFLNPLKSAIVFFEYLLGKIKIDQIYSSYPSYSIRIIDNMISENYNYSFFINPLHAHSNSLVIGLLVVNSIYYFFKNEEKVTYTNKYLISLVIFLGFAIISNTWDLIVYLFVILSMFLIYRFHEIVTNFKKYLITAILFIYPLAFIILPWTFYLVSPAGSLGVVKDTSNLIQLFLFWGLYLLIYLLFLYSYLKSDKHKFEASFSLYLSSVGIALIGFLEIFYFSDYLIKTVYYRTNTYYKFSNLIILFFSISLTFFLNQLIVDSIKKNIYKLIFTLTLIMVVLPFNIIIFKLKSNSDLTYTGVYSQNNKIRDIDSSLFELINYLNKIKKPNEILIEGGGESYTTSNFASVYTGIPTIYGWSTHELTWRANVFFKKQLESRSEDLKEFYTGEDLIKSQEIIKKYQINYILLSSLERNIYGRDLKEEKILKTGEIVFQRNNTYLLKSKL